MIERIYCINLDRRKDRLIQVNKEFEKHNIKNVKRVEAIDGKDLDIGQIVSKDKSICSAGDIGCTMSHLRVLNRAIKMGLKSYLVFEDDAQFHPNFNELHRQYWEQVPRDWDMVYLGASHIGEITKVSDNIVKMSKSYTTHAIIINNSIYKPLKEVWGQANEKVDIGISSLHSTYNCYCFFPNIVWQIDGYSDILGKEVQYEHLRND